MNNPQFSAQIDQISNQKVTYTWTIYKFDKDSMTQTSSSDFAPSDESQIKFNLKVTLKNSTFSYNKQRLEALLKLYMKNSNRNLNSRDNQNQNPNQRNFVSVYYRLSFLDADGEKFHSKDGKAVFSNTGKGEREEPIEGWDYRISYEHLSENGLLDTIPNHDRNSAKIFCELIMADDSNDTLETTTFEQKWKALQPKPEIEIPNPNSKSNEVLDHYQALLKSGTLSDMVLVVGKKEFHIHKAILAARSSVFAAMFTNDLEEKLTNRVVIPDLDAEVCELLLPYIYTGKIPSMEEYALELFFASDKYQLDHLKSICEQNLIKTLSVQTVTQTLVVADMHSASYLKRKCVEYITRNSEQVMATKGWIEMTKARPELLMELYKDISAEANSLKRSGSNIYVHCQKLPKF